MRRDHIIHHIIIIFSLGFIEIMICISEYGNQIFDNLCAWELVTIECGMDLTTMDE